MYTRRLDEAKQIVPGVQTFGDYRHILDMNDLDGIIVASPLHIHARHFLTLAAGKDMYAEKIMTWSIPEAEKCLQAARHSDRVVQIGLQHQTSGPFMDAKKWISDGIVGKVTQVESRMSRNSPHGKGQWVRPASADCTPQSVDWKAFLNGWPDTGFDAFKFINWRLFWMFSGGNITENMIHQMAWIMSVLDLSLPAYMSDGVFSEKDGREVPDTIAVTLDFPNELVVSWRPHSAIVVMDSVSAYWAVTAPSNISPASRTNRFTTIRRKSIDRTPQHSPATALTRAAWQTGSTACAAAKLQMPRSNSVTARL